MKYEKEENIEEKSWETSLNVILWTHLELMEASQDLICFGLVESYFNSAKSGTTQLN